MKIALLTVWTPPYKSFANLTQKVRKEYCLKHGYVCIGKEVDAFTFWDKFEQIASLLKEFDWVGWMDADTIITNLDIKLESFLGGPEDFIGTHDYNGFNTGTFFFRSSPWSAKWLDFFLNDIRPRGAAYANPEQVALANCMLKESKDRYKILPQKALNCYIHDLYGMHNPDGEWEPGDFILHLPILSTAERLRIFATI